MAEHAPLPVGPFTPRRRYVTRARGCRRVRRHAVFDPPPALDDRAVAEALEEAFRWQPDAPSEEARDHECQQEKRRRKKGVGVLYGAGVRRVTNYAPLQHLDVHLSHMMYGGGTQDMVAAVRRRLTALRLDPMQLTHYDIMRHMEECGIPSTQYTAAAYVLRVLQGRDPPKLSEHRRARIHALYTEYREALFRLSREHGWGVRNGAPIQFVLFKIAQMEGWNDIATLCRLYTTTDHALMAESRWRDVCGELGWPYRPTPPHVLRA